MNKKFKLGLALFFLGMLGVLTMLTVTISLDSLPIQLTEKFSAQTIKWLILINPSILLLLAVVIGTILFEKVGLTVPTISNALKIKNPEITFTEQLKYGISLGLITGILTTIIGICFKSSIPQELLDLGNKMKISTIARFGYGGITEEILMRFGFMTFIVWLVFKINKQLNNTTYWIGITLAALIFAIGHLPAVYGVIDQPSFSLLSYIILGNSVAGIFLGWLYWKKGLEAAFIGHIFAHVAMLLGEQLFQIH